MAYKWVVLLNTTLLAIGLVAVMVGVTYGIQVRAAPLASVRECHPTLLASHSSDCRMRYRTRV
jgi:hypothetical protein